MKTHGLIVDYIGIAERTAHYQYRPGWEGLATAQEALPTNAFGTDYRVLSRAWEALSPDRFLMPYKSDYVSAFKSL
jgi:hypothetical protein